MAAAEAQRIVQGEAKRVIEKAQLEEEEKAVQKRFGETTKVEGKVRYHRQRESHGCR